MNTEKAAITEKYIEGAELLKILAHPVRLGLIEMLLTKGSINVTTMYEEFQMPQSTISQHLGKLKIAKVISAERKGLEIFYHVRDQRVESILKMLISA